MKIDLIKNINTWTIGQELLKTTGIIFGQLILLWNAHVVHFYTGHSLFLMAVPKKSQDTHILNTQYNV